MNRYAISPVPDSDEEGTDFAEFPYNFMWEENFPFSGTTSSGGLLMENLIYL